MYVIFHDLKNNLQLVSRHFFLSVKKKQNLFAFSRIDFLRSFTLSLSLSNYFSTLHRHCVHTRVHRERLREISIRIAGVKKQKKSNLKKLAAKPQANFFSGEARTKAKGERKNVTNRGRFSALRGSIAPA